MQWYYSKNGTQLGPIPQSELISKLTSGEVSPADLVWKDGMGDWLPASQVGELSVLRPASVAAPSAVQETAAAPSVVPPVSPYAPPTAPTEVISNWLWQSIVVTLLCCPVCGIPGIIFATKVEGLKLAGNIQGARESAAKAKMWTLIGFGVSAAFWLVYLALIVVGIAASANSPTSAP
jgi:hypothetical protein